MKRALTLSHANLVAAVTAFIASEDGTSVGDVQFHVDSEGQVTAVATESETKSSGRASRSEAKETVAEEKTAGRTRRGVNKDADAGETEAVAETGTRSRRGSRGTATAEAEAEAPATTTRSRRGTKTEPAKPSVPEKSEDDYDIGADEADENVTYWVNKEDPSDVFSVPANQTLPDAELYDELESEEEALAALAETSVEETVAEDAPKTRRRGGSKTVEEEIAEEAPATTGRTRTRRGAEAQAEETAPATTGRRRLLPKK